MSTPAHNISVAVLGVLGGLGNAVATSLLKQGVQVLGIDGLDPGSADPVTFAWTLKQLRQHPRFQFFPSDLRSLTSHDLVLDEQPVGTLINCVGLHPFRQGITDKMLIDEIHGSAVLRLFDLAREAGVKQLIAPQYAQVGKEDHRSSNPIWQQLLAKEIDTAATLANDTNVILCELPSLIGPGQSLRIPPASMLMQLISKLPVEVPASDVPVAIVDLGIVANHLATLCLEPENESILEAIQSIPRYAVTCGQLLDFFVESGAFEIEGTTATLPAWGPTSSDTEPRQLDDDVKTILVALMEWVKALPFVPPADWPDVPARERRIMRSKRRRQKRNQQSGGKQ